MLSRTGEISRTSFEFFEGLGDLFEDLRVEGLLGFDLVNCVPRLELFVGRSFTKVVSFNLTRYLLVLDSRGVLRNGLVLPLQVVT